MVQALLSVHSAHRRLLVALLCWGLLPAGCSHRSAAPTARVFNLGERVEVGPLVYVAEDLAWHDRLGEGPNARLPQHRFLLVRLTITNSGIREADIPPFVLVASDGRLYPELDRGDGVPEWLGYLRTVQPAATEHGRVAFDVPGGAYRLRVAAVMDDDTEREAFIELPFHTAPSPQLPLAAPGVSSR
ncbi:MAG: DUF4352 domain-containing protein [Bryobacteraceae bacterium]